MRLTKTGKPNGKRWGKKFVDERDWPKYDEQLVVRGEFYLDLEFVQSWDAETVAMNSGRRGGQFQYPESFIHWQAVLHQRYTYRDIGGITRKLVEMAQLPKANHFTTVNRRVANTKIDFTLPQGNCSVSTDGSGMKFENGGEYRARMYGKRRKYLKVVISADPITKKVLAVDVFLEGDGDSEPDIAKKHMENLLAQGVDIDKFFGDGAFDDLDLFDFMDEHGIEPAVKTRENAVPSEGHDLRNQEVDIKKTFGYQWWAIYREYGKRWLGTEGIFSAVKRMFGEEVRAKKLENAIQEVKTRFWAYDLLKKYGESRA